MLGYALARTWPTSAEGFDDWLLRAIEHTGLLTGEMEAPTGESKPRS